MTKDEPASETEDRTDLPAPDFSTFIISMWTTALYQLGELPDPTTGQPAAPDRVMASQTIETLKMLRQKTEGNLDAEESELIEKILYELHMRFAGLEK